MKRAFLKPAWVSPPFWQTRACSLPRILPVHFLTLLSSLSFSISLWRPSYIMANFRLPPREDFAAQAWCYGLVNGMKRMAKSWVAFIMYVRRIR